MAFNNKTTMNEDTKAMNSSNPAYSYDEVFPALPVDLKPKAPTAYEHPRPSVPFPNQIPNMRIHSSEVTQVFIVPAEERKYDHSDKFGEGESMRTCALISKETGASIEISTSKDKSLTFMITGKMSNVMEARRRVLTNFQTQANVSISIPKEHHRWILGKNGQRLKDMEKNTGTKIAIPGINDPSDKVTVVGTRESIEKALHEIKVISDEQSKKAFERITVPKIYHPFITGANNDKLNQLIAETNARINVPPHSVDKEEITIAGEKEGVENAKNRILQIYHEMERTCQTISVQVPKWQHKYVIGSKRSTIAEILHETGISVEVPPLAQQVDSITLRGPYKLLGEALKILYAKATSMQCAEIECPVRFHKLIIGKKGCNIRELQDSYNQCHIEFTEDKIRIESSPDIINEVKEKLQAKVNYYLYEYDSVELEVNPKYFKHIIGKSGVNVNKLKNDHDVSITITETDSKNTIKVEGTKENVAQVKKKLEEQIKKLENEKEREITIDHKHHRTLTANKREKIRELQDAHKVTITFPNPGETSNIVKIRGMKDDVDRCYKQLSKIVKEMNENSYTLEVPIYKQFHKCIIGRGGSNVKKIRDETGTTIDLPAEGEKSDTIVITGKKEQVEEAKERILRIQNEMANIVTEEVTIPSNLQSRWKLLQAVRDDCGGVQIKLPPPDSRSDKVTIRGPSEDVARAKQQLLDLAAEKQISSYTLEVRAKPEHHKFLIGKSGSRIKKIRESTGARIIFPNENDEDKEVITIIGKKESAEKAKEELEAIIEQISNTVEDYVHVNPKYHKSFIVNRGELIHRISEECGGVIISFPRSSSQNDSRVVVKGNADGVREAIRTIEKHVQDLEEQVTIEVVIPNKDHRELLRSRTYPTVDDIRKANNVKIMFPDRIVGNENQQNGPSEVNGHAEGEEKEQSPRPCDIVQITGKPENCEAAKQMLLETVPIMLELEIPYSYHSSIIGQKGNVIREIISNYDVRVDVPNGELKLDLIKIRGRPASVEEAKNAILKRKKEIDDGREEWELRSYEVKLTVDPEYHPQIIGRGGEVINKIRNDHNVQISLPKKNDPANIITITGFQKDVEAASADILAIVQKLESRYREEVTIDRRVHSRMIGSKGRSVRKIMEEYEVEIRFPRETDPDPNIVVISGEQDRVIECKDHLLCLEEDFLQDVHDDVKAPPSDGPQDGQATNTRTRNEAGFVVKNAPWDQKAPDTSSISEFPSFGNVDNNKTFAQLGTKTKPVWGPRR